MQSENTPLLRAVQKGNIAIVKLLIRHGADLNKKNDLGKNALHLAASTGKVGLLKLFVERKLNVNIQDNDGFTPLVYAAEVGHLCCGEYLLKNGGDPTIKDHEKSMAIHWAAVGGNIRLVLLCFEYGCDINAVNNNGDTALHIAARRGNENMVYEISTHAIDSISVPNNEDKTPVHMTASIGKCSYNYLKAKKLLFTDNLRERLITTDLSKGKETVPIPVFNGVDRSDEIEPFIYVRDNIELDDLSRNINFKALSGCNCDPELSTCSTLDCSCAQHSLGVPYTDEGRLQERTIKGVKTPRLFECNDMCKCSSKCSNRVVQNGITFRVDLFKTKKKGWGVRAAQQIPKNSFICEYIGEVISDASADDRQHNDSYIYEICEDRMDTHCIDAATYANIARFINHSCEPNLFITRVYTNCQDLSFPRICFFTLKDIFIGEELSYDYGSTFWEMKKFKCACGTESCRYSN